MNALPLDVTCFSHLGITVSDLDASIDFYTRVLGFVRLFEDVQEEWTRVGIAIGDIEIDVFSPHPGASPDEDVDPYYPEGFGRPKIALTVGDAEIAYERVIAVGITPLCPVTTTRLSRFFFIADPDGTPVQLQEFVGGKQRLTELFA